MHPATQQLLVFLLGAAAFHGAYLSLLLFFKRKNTRESRLLGLVLGGVSLYLLNYLLFLTGLIRHFPGCLGVLYPWIFLAGGAFWFFVKTSLSGGFHWRTVHLLHFLPFLWAWYRVYPLLILPAERKQALIAWFLNPQEVFSPEMVLQGNVHLFLLLGYAVAARQWSAQREKQAERPENRRKSRWMKRFCTFFILLLVFDLGLKFSFVFAEIPAATAEYLLAVALALAIHRVGYFTMRRLDQHPGIPAEPAHEKYKTSPLTAEQLENSRLALLELMQRQKPWLDPELRMADLAEQLQLPSHHLSHILNEAVGAGFYDFVNGYRIREAQRLLLDERFRHFSIEAVGLESGFANKTTFNRVFKKMTGMSPSAYVERSGRVKPFTR